MKTNRDLKNFFNSLNEEQLDQELIIEITEFAVYRKMYCTILEEDYVNPHQEGAYPVSAHDDEDYVLTEKDVVMKKGTVHLSVGE